MSIVALDVAPVASTSSLVIMAIAWGCNSRGSQPRNLSHMGQDQLTGSPTRQSRHLMNFTSLVCMKKIRLSGASQGYLSYDCKSTRMSTTSLLSFLTSTQPPLFTLIILPSIQTRRQRSSSSLKSILNPSMSS